MRRTGVIVGIGEHRTVDECREIAQDLREWFPGVRIAVVPGSVGVTFAYDDGEVPPPPPAPPENAPRTIGERK